MRFDLVVMDQLGNAEELLTLGAHSAAHIIGGRESQVLGAQLHQLLHDGTRLAAGQKAAAHNGGTIGNHFCCLGGSQYRFLLPFQFLLVYFRSLKSSKFYHTLIS